MALVTFCGRLMGIVDSDAGVLDRLIMSDEVNFRLSRYINKQNYRHWSDQQPRDVLGKATHSLKVTAWSGVSALKLLELISLEKEFA